MASSKKIGIYWGEDKVVLGEVEKNVPKQIVSLPLAANTLGDSPFSSDVTEEIRIVALLQKALREHRLEGREVHFSLPVNEIILRSFIVPWVKPKELDAMVEFEAKKYIPFDLKEVAFVFHSIPFTENKIKKLRIIFFAIRKDIVERYDRILKQAGLTLVHAEPAPVSLAKALLTKKEIRIDERVAFVHLEEQFGRIYFIEKGVPQFFREFLLLTGPDGNPLDAFTDPEVIKSKIFNEIRNSLDFYARQFTNDKISRMYVQCQPNQQAYINEITPDLGVEIRNYVPTITAGATQITDLDAVLVTGAVSDVQALPSFNFIRLAKTSSSLLSFSVEDYIPVLKTAAVCAAIVGAAYAFSEYKLKEGDKQIEDLMLQQSEFGSMSEDAIREKIEENAKKLAGYQNVRIKSELSNVLTELSSILPAGAWLQNLNVRYTQEKSKGLSFEFNGSVYHPDPNQQIKIVNEIVVILKANKTLANYIKRVNLVSIQRQADESHVYTSFVINCL